MFGSLDCTHWVWKNCPYSAKGQYLDSDGDCSLILEAVATQDLWMWHAFLGLPGSCNNLNVLGCSPLIVNWCAPDYEFTVNGNTCKLCFSSVMAFIQHGLYLLRPSVIQQSRKKSGLPSARKQSGKMSSVFLGC